MQLYLDLTLWTSEAPCLRKATLIIVGMGVPVADMGRGEACWGERKCARFCDTPHAGAQSFSASGWTSWLQISSCPSWWSSRAPSQWVKAQNREDRPGWQRLALRWANQGLSVLCFWQLTRQHSGCFKIIDMKSHEYTDLQGSQENERFQTGR